MKRKIVILENPKCFGKVGKPVMECSKCIHCFDCIEMETKRKIKEEKKPKEMKVSISLSSSDLERIKDVLGYESYDDIHNAMVEAFEYMLEKEEEHNYERT